MAYLLATTDVHVRWYVVRLTCAGDIVDLKKNQFELMDHLNLAIVPGFGNKDTAKRVAKALGLTTWRYVRLDSPNTIFTLE